MNNREKQAAFRQRMQEKGLAQVTEWIPADERESYRKIAADMREGKGLPPPQAKGSKKLQSMEEVLSEEAERARLSVEEHLLRKVAEDLYWLHLMLSRRLAGGSTSMPSTMPEEQAEMFGAWVKSLKSVSGRLGVFDTDTSSGIKVDVRPYAAAPVRLNMSLEYAGKEVTSNQPSDQEAIAQYYRASKAKDPKSALDRAVRAYVAAEVEPQIEAEVKKRVAKRQEELTRQETDLKRLFQEAMRDQDRANDLLKNLDGLMTEDEYRLIRGCLHPDRADEEVRAKFGKAFHIFSRLEKSVNREMPIALRRKNGWS